MGFYGPEPFSTATATYIWTGLGGPGFFLIEVEGNAPNYTSGITLVRDERYVCGLQIDVMGWTGPLGQGTTHYKVQSTFPGQLLKEIVVKGSNKTEVILVREIPAAEADAFFQARTQAQAQAA